MLRPGVTDARPHDSIRIFDQRFLYFIVLGKPTYVRDEDLVINLTLTRKSQRSNIVRTKMIVPQRHLKQFPLTCNLCMKEDSMKRSPQRNFWTKTYSDISASLDFFTEIPFNHSKNTYREIHT